MVSSTPRLHFTPGKDPVPILQVAGWAPGPVLRGGKSRPHGDSIADRPARSSVAIPTELPYNQHTEVKPHELEFKNMENIAYHFTQKIPSIMWILAGENGMGFNMKACSDHLGLMRG